MSLTKIVIHYNTTKNFKQIQKIKTVPNHICLQVNQSRQRHNHFKQRWVCSKTGDRLLHSNKTEVVLEQQPLLPSILWPKCPEYHLMPKLVKVISMTISGLRDQQSTMQLLNQDIKLLLMMSYRQTIPIHWYHQTNLNASSAKSPAIWLKIANTEYHDSY